MSAARIVSRFDHAKVLFECEIPEEGIAAGMATRHALEKAAAARADLSGADLGGMRS